MTEMYITKSIEESSKRKNKRYTKEEVEIIRTHYPIGGYKKVQEFLPDRSAKSIAEKARTSGISTDNRADFTREEIEILREHYPLVGASGVRELLPHRTEDVIRQKTSALGIQGTTNFFTEEDDDIIKHFYPEWGYEEVLKYLPNRTKGAIQSRASKIGVSFMTYNEDYFEKINSEDKAYWLGFMYADGWVTTKNRWGLTLSSVDLEHMKKFTADFESNINIRTRKRVSHFPEYSSEHETSTFMIKNRKMYNDLVRNGVFRNKTHTLKFPTNEQVPESLMSHFIRGYFDGDGSYPFYEFKQVRKDRGNKEYTRQYKDISLVCMSKSFITSLYEYLIEKGIEMNLNHNEKTNLYTLRTSKSSVIINFIDYVYKDSITHLDRKHKKAQEMYDYCLSYLKECETKTN